MKPPETYMEDTPTTEKGRQGIFKINECTTIVSIDDGKWHLSISHPSRLPTYDELKDARYRYMPNGIYAAMILPPREEFVNLHPYCLHLYEI